MLSCYYHIHFLLPRWSSIHNLILYALPLFQVLPALLARQVETIRQETSSRHRDERLALLWVNYQVKWLFLVLFSLHVGQDCSWRAAAGCFYETKLKRDTLIKVCVCVCVHAQNYFVLAFLWLNSPCFEVGFNNSGTRICQTICSLY